jgi:hypothetical protein
MGRRTPELRSNSPRWRRLGLRWHSETCPTEFVIVWAARVGPVRASEELASVAQASSPRWQVGDLPHGVPDSLDGAPHPLGF